MTFNESKMCLPSYIGGVENLYSYDRDDSFFIYTGSMVLGVFTMWILNILFGSNHSGLDRSKVPPLDIKDTYYDKAHRVCGDVKVRHRVILVRHGESEHNKRHDRQDGVDLPSIPLLDTPLTNDGHKQAEDVGRFLASFDWHPDVIRVSPMIRAVQTAEPFLRWIFCKHTLASITTNIDDDGTVIKTNVGKETRFVADKMCMEVNTWGDQELKLDSYTTHKETYNGFVERVKEWKKVLENDGLEDDGRRLQTVVFTHSMVISELLNLIVSENRENVSDDTWSKIYWQVNNGSITCLDYMDNGEWHVQAMNYTRHITRHTGTKSPFV